MPQGVLRTDRGIGVLSLGNFLLRPDYSMPPKARRSVVATLSITPDTLALTLRPIRIEPSGKPTVPSADEASVNEIAVLSSQHGTAVEVRDGVGYLTVERRRPRSSDRAGQ